MTRTAWTLAAAATFAAMTSPAHAVTFNLTAPTSQTSGYSVNTNIQGVGTISNIGNALTYKTGSGATALALKATAYSLNTATGLITAAAINVYGKSTNYVQDYGLGIQDQFENNNNPNHSIDNSGVVDFLVLQFDKAVNFTSFNIGWAYNDADTSMSWLNTDYAYLNLNGKNISTLSALGSTNFDVNGAVTGARNYTIPTAINTVVIYARNGSGADKYADYFKINSVTATAAVPEPATWAMMLAGFGAVGYAMRRRKQGAPALPAVEA